MLLLAACGPSAPAPAGPEAALPPVFGGQPACGTQRLRFDEPGLPARDYEVYRPCSLASDARPPLVVYLHGCTQDAAQAATQTRWNALADAHGLVVAYPEQFDPNTEAPGAQQLQDHALNGNGARCWNWFRPEHIARGAGEVATIAGITQRVLASQGADPDRVLVMGISAGGAMTTAMAATYPELFAAAVALAGEGYPAGAADPAGALVVQAMGERLRPMPMMVVQGSLDELVPLPAGSAIVQQWLGANDSADDGSANGSVPRTPASTEQHGVDETALDGAGTPGDTCVGNRRGSPCPGGVLGFASYPYTVEHYADASGAPLLDYWVIHGLMHNYAGGDPSVPFSDPLGPDITAAAYAFFAAHPRTR